MKYNVIYADPPWSYSQKSAGRGNKSGARDKYQVMSLKDIQELPIKDIIEDSALLFMWCTVPLLPDCLQVLPAWGFKYKTMINWEKTGCLGMGNWLRIQNEILVIGVKGKVKPFKFQQKNLFQHKILKHSEKPHYFRQLVSSLAQRSFDQPKKVELFARSKSDLFPSEVFEGWDVYGNEVENSIELTKP